MWPLRPGRSREAYGKTGALATRSEPFLAGTGEKWPEKRFKVPEDPETEEPRACRPGLRRPVHGGGARWC